MPKAKGIFEVKSFKEDAYEEREAGAKLTHAWGDQAFSGDIEAEGAVHWLMSYGTDEKAHFVGIQRIKGELGGRSGSFIIEATGDFDGAASRGTWSVIPGSGLGDLASISGNGSFDAPGGPSATYELEYELG